MKITTRRWYCLRRWEDDHARIQYRFGLEGHEYFGVSYERIEDPLFKVGEIYEVEVTINPKALPLLHAESRKNAT
jgi:hypothetical protein